MRQTILLFQFGDLGDTILTVPAIRAVRKRHLDARLVLLGKSTACTYLVGLGLVDEAIDVDKHVFDRPMSVADPRALAALFRLIKRLRREQASTVVVFHHLVTRWGAWKFAALTLASGARRRLGVDNGRGWFLTERVRDRGFGFRHEAEYWLEVAGLLQAEGDLRLEAPPISSEDRRVAQRLLGDMARGRRILAIHAGTGWYGPGRQWPAESFAEAARLVMACEDVACVLVGTRQDEEAARRVADLMGQPVASLIGRTSVGELAAVLEHCALLLANDGGVAHLAAALGIPVVAVFGPSNDRAWHPLHAHVVASDLPCRPCFYRDFERGLPEGCATRECLTLVTPEIVARRALMAIAV
jgi:heptosyltransferase-2